MTKRNFCSYQYPIRSVEIQRWLCFLTKSKMDDKKKKGGMVYHVGNKDIRLESKFEGRSEAVKADSPISLYIPEN